MYGTTRHFFKNLFMLFLWGLIPLIALGIGLQYNGEVKGVQPDKVAPGFTLFNIFPMGKHFTKHISIMDAAGQNLWTYHNEDLKGRYTTIAEFELLPNGNILVMDLYGCLWELDPRTEEVVWFYRESRRAQHDVDLLPDGRLIFLQQYQVRAPEYSPRMADAVVILNPKTKKIEWEWKAEDHFSFDEYCPLDIRLPYYGGHDWLHCNGVIYRRENNRDFVYLSVCNLNRFCKIDMQSGDFVWCLGDGGDFGAGLFSHAHSLQLLDNGNLLLFDNGLHRNLEPGPGVSRVIEIAFDPEAKQAEIVWEYNGDEPFFSRIMGYVQRLENGNTLITDSSSGRLLEVTPAGEKVWEYQLAEKPNYIYKAIRLPEWPW